MSRLLLFLVVLVLYISFECYALSGLKQIFDSSSVVQFTYAAILIFVWLGFYKAYKDFRKIQGGIRPLLSNLFVGFGFAVFVSKIVFVGLLMLQDGVILLSRLLNGIASFFVDYDLEILTRNDLATSISALLASIPFVSMMYGITLGKYRFKVEKLILEFPDLPKAFDGFKLVQISDIHAGSFDSLEQVQKGVDIINAQQADLLVFTGDLVNSLKEEIDPYIEAFSNLSAPFGMYSILGNHDYYGMYQVAQNDPVKRKIYMDDFKNKQEKIGFNLLNNESTLIEKEGDKIRLIGVENWGSGPFPKVGDLDKALIGVHPNEFSILLSHDPTHWDHHVIPHSKHIHLTLSGHTHGMQFGINIGRFKWSPVKYRYKKWIGLYEQAEQYLYVNRGFGFLAWPGRVGMSPEITVFELKNSS